MAEFSFILWLDNVFGKFLFELINSQERYQIIINASMFNIMLFFKVLKKLDDPVFTYVDTGITHISADSHCMALSQQRSFYIKSHVLCSCRICLENDSLRGVGESEFFVGPICQAKYVIGI